MDKNNLNERGVEEAARDYYDKTHAAGSPDFNELDRHMKQFLLWRMSDAVNVYINSTRES